MNIQWIACLLRCAVADRCKAVFLLICCRFRRISASFILFPIEAVDHTSSTSMFVKSTAKDCLRNEKTLRLSVCAASGDPVSTTIFPSYAGTLNFLVCDLYRYPGLVIIQCAGFVWPRRLSVPYLDDGPDQFCINTERNVSY